VGFSLGSFFKSEKKSSQDKQQNKLSSFCVLFLEKFSKRENPANIFYVLFIHNPFFSLDNALQNAAVT